MRRPTAEPIGRQRPRYQAETSLPRPAGAVGGTGRRPDEDRRRRTWPPGFDRAVGIALCVVLAVMARIVSGSTAWLSTALAAVVLGAVAANLPGSWSGRDRPLRTVLEPGAAMAATRVLRVGIVLLGFRLSFADLLALGPLVLVATVAVVSLALLSVRALVGTVGLGRDLSLLIAVGYAICGASAIATVTGAIDADEDDAATAVALVALFGGLSIVVVPLVAAALGLEPETIGLWSGLGVHDTAQVVAVAAQSGSAALAVAIAVKLARVLLLAPVTTIIAGVAAGGTASGSDAGSDGEPTFAPAPGSRLRRGGRAAGPGRTATVPVFLVGFLVAIAVRSLGLLDESAIDWLRAIEGWVFAVALVGLGVGVDQRRLQRLGPRAVVAGAASWVLILVLALGMAVALPR